MRRILRGTRQEYVKSNDQLLESFREAYRNLQLLPLITPEELDRFRVEYGGKTLGELEQVVEDCAGINNKVIFAGHRGCGKSTLLAEFKRRKGAANLSFVAHQGRSQQDSFLVIYNGQGKVKEILPVRLFSGLISIF